MATQKISTPELPEARRNIKPNKGGRPKKAEGEKKKLVSVYFTDAERKKISEDAKEAYYVPRVAVNLKPLVTGE